MGVLQNYFEGTLGDTLGVDWVTLRVLWDPFGGMLGTTLGGVWSHFEGDMGVLGVP